MRLLSARAARIVGGKVWFEGNDLLSLPEPRLRAIHGRRIGMIFQNPSSYLDPLMTIGQQVAEPLIYQEELQPREAHRRDRKSTRLNSSHIPLSRMPSSA